MYAVIPLGLQLFGETKLKKHKIKITLHYRISTTSCTTSGQYHIWSNTTVTFRRLKSNHNYKVIVHYSKDLQIFCLEHSGHDIHCKYKPGTLCVPCQHQPVYHFNHPLSKALALPMSGFKDRFVFPSRNYSSVGNGEGVKFVLKVNCNL